ncbi:MAG: hypothetical protein WA173_19515 [Pseudomonas sp.]|uniref:hypothetical protein n=1 Tax=Pseudomonas sp. TaxID=306 RepID=UPI00271D0C6C|nr:hypothetical protein [Pseudomonas sp.]
MLKHISTLALAAFIAITAGCIYYDPGYGHGHHRYYYYDGGYHHWDGWQRHHKHHGKGH